jgi:hypothetical protein
MINYCDGSNVEIGFTRQQKVDSYSLNVHVEVGQKFP